MECKKLPQITIPKLLPKTSKRRLEMLMTNMKPDFTRVLQTSAPQIVKDSTHSKSSLTLNF